MDEDITPMDAPPPVFESPEPDPELETEPELEPETEPEPETELVAAEEDGEEVLTAQEEPDFDQDFQGADRDAILEVQDVVTAKGDDRWDVRDYDPETDDPPETHHRQSFGDPDDLPPEED